MTSQPTVPQQLVSAAKALLEAREDQMITRVGRAGLGGCWGGICRRRARSDDSCRARRAGGTWLVGHQA